MTGGGWSPLAHRGGEITMASPATFRNPHGEPMIRYVEIAFDCLPLRSVTRFDIPLDASPKFRARCERIKAALERHGSHNTYYLYNASCTYRLTNSESLGMLEFSFEGTVLTGENDQNTVEASLEVSLEHETCEWLTEPIVGWFRETVRRSVMVEFDRYIAVGDLEQTLARLKRLETESDEQGGFLGMFL
jgi:hypothetical protein